MQANTEYTGTHKVVLPLDYMNSVEAACDLHEEHIVDVGTNLDIPGLSLSWAQRLRRFTLACLFVWLIPLILQFFN
ncbi:MAG: hypothetical protein ACN4GT_02915 [Gammaproteobacteria bacterium]